MSHLHGSGGMPPATHAGLWVLTAQRSAGEPDAKGGRDGRPTSCAALLAMAQSNIAGFRQRLLTSATGCIDQADIPVNAGERLAPV